MIIVFLFFVYLIIFNFTGEAEAGNTKRTDIDYNNPNNPNGFDKDEAGVIIGEVEQVFGGWYCFLFPYKLQ